MAETAVPDPLGTAQKGADNVVLIGMPAAGKSTVGVLLAKATARDFLDTDLYIQNREGRPLSAILATEGRDGFRRIEEEAVLGIAARHTVIATGGSVVYGERAMAHLKASGIVVYLQLPVHILAQRISDFTGRGVVMAEDQNLEDLLAEREPLYRRWADITIECEALHHQEVLDRTVAALSRSASL